MGSVLSTRAKIWWAVITVVVLVGALFPVLSIFMTSFKGPSDINSGTFLPPQWSTDNYEQILATGGSAQELFLSALRNSIGISLIATVIAVVVTIPVVVLVVLFQRQIVSGLTQGAVKG